MGQICNKKKSHILQWANNCVIIYFLLLFRERLEDNLVNAMETIDNNLGTEGSPTPSRSSMVFKISSKSEWEHFSAQKDHGKLTATFHLRISDGGCAVAADFRGGSGPWRFVWKRRHWSSEHRELFKPIVRFCLTMKTATTFI